MVKRLGGSPFLTPDDVADGTIVEIAAEPVLVSAEQSKWGRERYRMEVVLPSGEARNWTMNTTTSDNLLEAYGEDGKAWVGQRVKIHKEQRTVGKEKKTVLFGEPHRAPQQTLDADKPVGEGISPENKQLLQAIIKLAPDAKKALMSALKEA